MKEVGFIAGDVKPTTYTVTLTDPTVGRGSFIKVEHSVHGWVLARIEALKTYLDDFDEQKTNATAYVIGYLDASGQILLPKTPFKPKEKIYLADNKLIISILGLNTARRGSLYIGLLEGHEIPVYLDINKTINKHVSVLAKTGAGKSYTVAVILEELLKNKVPVVIIDPHGEYSSLCVENDDYDNMLRYDVKATSYLDRIVEYTTDTDVNPTAKKLVLKPEFNMMELTDIIPMRLTDKQAEVLYTALAEFAEDEIEYDLKDLIRRLEEEPTAYKWKVINGLEDLMDCGVFEGEPVDYTELVQDGKATVINLKGTTPQIQALVVAKLTRDLFDARPAKPYPPSSTWWRKPTTSAPSAASATS